ncbi:class I SAM-dependent methyltransferase [Longispora albida]|uniref:class I SAM-dependent methyltransferase n=1 Tax=Longispora albida TaxID=203523 RepID=UPI000375633B|nr:class I SAM-dependent methyltransferase [Longispora albida]
MLTFDRPAEACTALQSAVDELLGDHLGSRALEAGAGKRTRLSLPPDTYVIGVDTDPNALAWNKRLDERVLCDLMEYTPPPRSFDLITCWYVLEHVDRPDLLVERFAGWLRPGGLMVLAVPHLASPKSLVTKWTPHSFHIWFRRRIAGSQNAGKPGFGPYPTTLRRSIAPRHLARRATDLGLSVAFEGYFEDNKQRKLREKLKMTGMSWRAAQGLTRAASLGQLDARRTEYLVVLQKEI